jgi:gamma-glutamylcyclotransferase (GGCT)/AIG2-like uncharacterized protein YtfP
MFVYGELCKPSVLLEILGRVPVAEPALLDGFRREINPATGYFRVARHPSAIIAGLLLKGIEMVELEKIDAFENVEGGECERINVEVETLRSAVRKTAWIYVAT